MYLTENIQPNIHFQVTGKCGRRKSSCSWKSLDTLLRCWTGIAPHQDDLMSSCCDGIEWRDGTTSRCDSTHPPGETTLLAWSIRGREPTAASSRHQGCGTLLGFARSRIKALAPPVAQLWGCWEPTRFDKTGIGVERFPGWPGITLIYVFILQLMK